MTTESEQLENVLFKIGSLPISETVVTTWAVMLGLLDSPRLFLQLLFESSRAPIVG